jgi:hypothetical protein
VAAMESRPTICYFQSRMALCAIRIEACPELDEGDAFVHRFVFKPHPSIRAPRYSGCSLTLFAVGSPKI